MAWSYSGKPTEDNPKDQVRFLIQDTEESDQLFQDEEIDFLLELEGGPLKAATKGAQTLAAKFARCVDETVGKVKATFSQRYKHYSDLAKQLKQHSDIRIPLPFAGALRISQKDVQERDNDRVPPAFSTETHEFSRTRDQVDGRIETGGLQGDNGPAVDP